MLSAVSPMPNSDDQAIPFNDVATAVIACFVAVERDFALATAAALAAYGLAGERAAQIAQGPGTFPAHLMDALAGLTSEAVQRGARIQEECR